MIRLQGVHLDPSIYLMDEDNGTDTASQKEARLATVEPPASPPQRTTSINSEPGSAQQPARAPGDSEPATTHALKALVEDGNRDHFSEKTKKAVRSDKTGSNALEVNGISTLNGDSSSSEGMFATSKLGCSSVHRPVVVILISLGFVLLRHLIIRRF